MTMLEQFDADVKSAETDLPVDFVFRTKAYTGQRLPDVQSQELVDAGIIPKSDFDLLVRPSIFGLVPVPAKNDEIEIDEVVYRVNVVTKSQDGITILYALVLRT